MSEYVETLAAIPVVVCDSCGKKECGPEQASPLAWDFVKLVSETKGWQTWGGRSQRHYCPDCNPKPGHKMYLIYGEARP